MEYCIYHSRDLDGLTSGAIAYANQRQFGEDCTLVGYDYGQKLDTRRFKGKSTLMVDVSMDMESMDKLGNNCQQLIWVDHHVSAYNQLLQYCEDNSYSIQETQVSELIKKLQINQMNVVYYYSSVLSGCEMMAALFGTGISKEAKTFVAILGQYDTWRNTEDKKRITDKDWDKVVMPIQYFFRSANGPIAVFDLLNKASYYGEDKLTLEKAVSAGTYILEYQKIVNASNGEKHFDFEFEGLYLTALNTTMSAFNSLSFNQIYHQDVFQAMMPFCYDGRDHSFKFSLYTTREDVDILSIAKKYGGGGHAKACGFSIPAKYVHFIDDKIVIKSLETNDVYVPEVAPKYSKRGCTYYSRFERDYMIANINKNKFEADFIELSEEAFINKYQKDIINSQDYGKES